MDTDYLKKILGIVERKYVIDQGRDWSNGSSTYFDEIPKELAEVKEELENNRRPHLEDELGDVFWDYLNLLINLENEGKIMLSEVFRRAAEKYEERVGALEKGITWDEVKQKQKKRLAEELE